MKIKIEITINHSDLDLLLSAHKKENEKSTPKPQASANDQHGDAKDQPEATLHDRHPTNFAEHLQMDQQMSEAGTGAPENRKHTASSKPKGRDFRCKKRMERLFREIAQQQPHQSFPYGDLQKQPTSQCCLLCQLLDFLKTQEPSHAEASAQQH